MKLAYLPHYGGVLKPFVEVVILGQRPFPTRALVDSGADYCLFDLSLAQAAGIAVDLTSPRPLRGLGGSIQAYPGELTIEVARRRVLLRSLFAQDFSPNLLGRDNFFHHFRVCFDELNHELELRYRRKRPATASPAL